MSNPFNGPTGPKRATCQNEQAHNTTAYYGDETTLRSCKLIRDIENA